MNTNQVQIHHAHIQIVPPAPHLGFWEAWRSPFWMCLIQNKVKKHKMTFNFYFYTSEHSAHSHKLYIIVIHLYI